jgi:hypothetical protein
MYVHKQPTPCFIILLQYSIIFISGNCWNMHLTCQLDRKLSIVSTENCRFFNIRNVKAKQFFFRYVDNLCISIQLLSDFFLKLRQQVCKRRTCLQNIILLIIKLIQLSVVLLFEHGVINFIFNISLRLFLFTKTP